MEGSYAVRGIPSGLQILTLRGKCARHTFAY